jgi:beta-N-acetylhexosaminidase
MNDLEIALGQCFWIGINGITVDDPYTKEIFDLFQPGGICLFQRNVESIDQITRLNAGLQKMSRIPMFMAVDQEGGTVERLHKIIGTIPPFMAISAARKPLLARRIHQSHARILRALGFNVNFTPVLDLAVQNADNGLGTRCFSNDPDMVTRYAREVIEAHSKEGVLTCGKHFPGLGDTDRDSHLDLPTVSRPWKQVVQEDLLPYKRLLPELRFIMVNHALYPEKNEELPASLAREIVTDFLQNKWNYQGFSISDDLIMGAVSNIFNLTDSCEKALVAGNHLFLICRPEEVASTYSKLLRRVRRSIQLQQTIFRNSSKILAYKYLRPDSKRPVALKTDISRMKTFSDEVTNDSITLLRGRKLERTPLECTIFYPLTKWLNDGESELTNYLAARGTRVKKESFPLQLKEVEGASLAAKSTTEFNIVIATNLQTQPGQMMLIEHLLKANKQVALIVGAFPSSQFPKAVRVAVASYWTSPAALKAAAGALFGDQKMKGALPFK